MVYLQYLLYSVHILVCIFLILVVLLQQGKGADLSVFGGGSTQTAFGARSATTLLHKLTVASFVVFILTTISIGVFQGTGGSSVVSGVGRAKGKTTAAVPPPAAAPVPVDHQAGSRRAGPDPGDRSAADETGGSGPGSADPAGALNGGFKPGGRQGAPGLLESAPQPGLLGPGCSLAEVAELVDAHV